MPNPTVLVLLGITGDLAQKKILPALYNLHLKELLPADFQILGFSRREWTKIDLYEFICTTVFKNKDAYKTDKTSESFVKRFSYINGTFEDQTSYMRLGSALLNIQTHHKSCVNKLFYLSVAPEHYEIILDGLYKNNLAQVCPDEGGWARILIEKPFGKDSATASVLETKLAQLFSENQIYRIDHYLGKEMMQNILAFRFSNTLLEASWNRTAIESIEIKVHESIGIEGRTNYYDGVGALRDIGQNHILQMLALITMEEPYDMSAHEIRKRRANLLNDLFLPSDAYIKEFTKRGQYKGYLDELGVDKHSQTETYFKLTTFIQNDRWKEVPILLESGKKLKASDKAIIINYKAKNGLRNRVMFDLEGKDMGISIEFWAKKPGIELSLEKRKFSFSLCDDFDTCNIAQPYEKLLLDSIEGNQTLFVSTDEIRAMWRFVDPILKGWETGMVKLDEY